MLARRIASRYAEALFDLAQRKGKAELWERELGALASAIAASPDLQSVLTHPEIPSARKQELLARAFGGTIAPEILAMLRLLIKRGHEPDLEIIHEILLDRWNRARRVLPVTVTSAAPLTDAQAQALTRALARRTGATVRLSRAVDPALIAGMVILIGDRVIDASARTALEQLRAAMAG